MNRGCVSWASSNDTSKSYFLQVQNNLGRWTTCNEVINSCLLWSDSSTWTIMDSKVLSTQEAWTDQNCRICGSSKSVCDYCKNGYIKANGIWTGMVLICKF